jgi:cell wall-associated NlpC family hydrolase
MVSQLLFGETCVTLEKTRDRWVRVRCLYDGYEGWCQEGHVLEGEEEHLSQSPGLLAGDLVNELGFNGGKMIIPLGSVLTGLNNGKLEWKQHNLYYKGTVFNPAEASKDEATIRAIAFKFLNTAYLWGGKSVFGVDCSGFTQTLYKFLGVQLWRDAYQQATQGEVIGFLQEARCGDLAFFDNDEGRITHVGVLLNDHEIIHASVKVRVDKIDNFGIMHAERFERTHKLRIIRRYF